MAKASGWANWKSKYWSQTESGRWIDYGKRGRDLADPAAIKTREELETFAENSKGPVQRQLWNDELITYSNEGAIVVQTDKVAIQAEFLITDSKSDAASIAYMVHAYREQLQARGIKYADDKAAEREINRDQATRARAILLSAAIGRVRLTEAQRQRLREIAEGKFMALIYRRYKEREARGDLLGLTPRKGGRAKDEAERARNREFADMAREHRINV